MRTVYIYWLGDDQGRPEWYVMRWDEDSRPAGVSQPLATVGNAILVADAWLDRGYLL